MPLFTPGIAAPGICPGVRGPKREEGSSAPCTFECLHPSFSLTGLGSGMPNVGAGS